MYLDIMIFIFVWINSSFAAGAPQLICPSQTVSAEEEGSVKRRIWMDPPSDITDDDLIIERADLEDVIVYHYDKMNYHNDHAQAPGMKNRVHVAVDPISGVLDLEIWNLSLNDSGPYRVSSIDHRSNCTFNISVAAKVDRADGGLPLMETLKTVLPVSVVPVTFTAVVIFLWRSGWIKKVWPRVRGRVCRLFGGSKGPDPDPEVGFNPVPVDDADPQVVHSST